MINEKEAEVKAIELIKLSIEAKQLSEKIKDIKAELKDFCQTSNINEKVWMADNGFVEYKTETKYKLADIPADVKIDSDLNIPNDTADAAFKFKASLTKKGKELFRENYQSIVCLMIPNIKSTLKINI